MSFTIKKAFHFIKTLSERFNDAGCTYRASALTFTSLLSLVPLMTVSFGILAAFPEFRRYSKTIQNFIFNNFVATSGKTIQNYLQVFVSHAAQLSAIGLFFLVITSISMMLTLEQTLNAIWRVRIARPWISALLLYWTMLTLSPILIGVGFAISSYLASLSFVTSTASSLGLTEPLLTIAPFLLSVSAFTLIYIAVPNCKVPFRYGFIGALTAGILFEIAKFAFALYITQFPTYEFLYGALAAVPIFLLWIYVCWLIALTGAVVSNTLFTYYDDQGKPIDPFTQSVCWLKYFWQAQQVGTGLTLANLLDRERGLRYQVAPEEQMHALIAAKLLQPIHDGSYLLSRDLANFTLADLHNQLPWALPKSVHLIHHDDATLQKFTHLVQQTEQELLTRFNISLTDLYQEQF